MTQLWKFILIFLAVTATCPAQEQPLLAPSKAEQSRNKPLWPSKRPKSVEAKTNWLRGSRGKLRFHSGDDSGGLKSVEAELHVQGDWMETIFSTESVENGTPQLRTQVRVPTSGNQKLQLQSTLRNHHLRIEGQWRWTW